MLPKGKGTNNFKLKVYTFSFQSIKTYLIYNDRPILLIDVVLKLKYIYEWVSRQYQKNLWAKNTSKFSLML